MITLETFLGALLDQTARARAISDQASVHIAEEYLHHELLKGYSVPRMLLRDVEVELQFAVASGRQGAPFLDDEEVQKSITYQLRDWVSNLPNHRSFRSYFGKNNQLAASWRSGLEEMSKRFAQILSKPDADLASVMHSLSLSVQNYFHESATEDLRSSVSSLLVRPLRKQSGQARSMHTIIEQQIRTIVTSMDRNKSEGRSDVAPNLNVLVGAAELEKLNPAILDKIKVTITPSDRRWVASEQDGKKVYILGT